ncbi:Gfo/Idh/MocA family oxidoreductase [Nitrosopumilus sp. b2]|uniref:Gfo/Idh/MocA family oxidoreductase n=1 Tax=Nitrosopumilus sp. b2 TaxID=2109908 RepID=UPI0015F5CEE7|nr:Gfo/Idh/MocA family oxidoreductase [Nitrosopumilus sp. b2]
MTEKFPTGYDLVTNIHKSNFENKSVLIIGGGEMGKQYSHALTKMNIKNVTIISQTSKDSKEFSDKFQFEFLSGGFEKNLPSLEKMDLVIVATPTPLLLPATKLAVEYGQDNILVEKPGSLYHKELLSLLKNLKSQRIRIAYNRILYPSFQKLKSMIENDGGVTSCTFDFTEWIHRIPFGIYKDDEYQYWGIANSLHVISMAMEIIGMPTNISTYQLGSLDWHNSGSTFVGSGITDKNISFSYHADWGSAGRWGIEIITKNNAFRLIPLEELYACPKGKVDWKQIELEPSYPEIKTGIAEEIAVMLDPKLEQNLNMITLEKSIKYNKLAEKIFNYN